MILAPLPAKVVRLHTPLPYSIYDANGQLLLPKGAMVSSEEQRSQLLNRGAFVDKSEADVYERAFAGKLDGLVRKNVILRHLAEARPDAAPSAPPPPPVERQVDLVSAWLEMESRAGVLLNDTPRADWLPRFSKFRADTSELLARDPDGALFVLMQTLRDPAHRHSTIHALLVAIVCELTARQLQAWPAAAQESIACAALTMNWSIMQLQDRLATQGRPPTPQQQTLIQQHPAKSVEILRAAGVTDEMWLQAVAQHHGTRPGPLAGRPPSEQLARVIQRADVLIAGVSVRANRRALSPTSAAHSIYSDEQQQADEAGGAIIKALGLYPPGCFVRLKNGEVAVVLARGHRANEPLVASIVGREGLPLGLPAVRDTRLPNFTTVIGVAAHEVKVMLNPLQMLKLR